MMKKVYLLCALFPFLLGNAQSPEPTTATPAFGAGEWFKFRIHYGIFNASYATLQVKNDTYKGKPVYHVIGRGKTTGLARLFFKVDDRYESYFDIKNGQPYRFIRKIDEGGYTKNLEINFDHNNNIAHVNDKKHSKKTELEFTNGVHDLISAFYYLRNNYEASDLKKGSDIVLNLLYDDDESFKFKLKYLGKETVNTKFGKVPCLKFRPYVQSGRVFKEQESLTLWVSNDKNKIPVRIKANLAVGSLKADLEGFKGLKHQFKIVKK